MLLSVIVVSMLKAWHCNFGEAPLAVKRSLHNGYRKLASPALRNPFLTTSFSIDKKLRIQIGEFSVFAKYGMMLQLSVCLFQGERVG